MITYNNILAIVDTREHVQAVMQKALHLAKSTDAQVTLMSVLTRSAIKAALNKLVSKEAWQELLVQEQQKLTELLLPLGEFKKAPILKVCENTSVYLAIQEELLSVNYDLVIKSNHRLHHAMSHWFSTDDDWHLIRDIGTPILFVGKRYWHKGGHIITAIETQEKKAGHDEFNKKILAESNQLGKILSAEVHLLSCYLGESTSLAISAGPTSVAPKSLEERHWQYLCDSNRDLRFGNEQIHVLEGLPDDMIPQLAQQYNADVVIIGAGEHRGFWPAIKGHTSAYIIDQLSCDLLALKPEQLGLH